MLEAYRAGTTMAVLAERYGVRRQTIGELLHREGVPKRRSKRMKPAEIDQAVELYESGLSLKKVGERLQRDHNMIWRQLKKRGVVMRSPNDRPGPRLLDGIQQ
ncbi:hypothetical protein GCM10022242_00050 [Nocardioides panacisoli]|uniref:Helix-turn-helix domain-containing protein n=1 Tax=Nocardioides panacisoli TaxID=627624 RepID=A0ABP7HPE0_9ACTN